MEHPGDIYRDARDRLVAAVHAIANPFERIRTVKDLIDQGGLVHRDLAAITAATVRELHADGMSYAAIARELGVTRSRVEQLAKGR